MNKKADTIDITNLFGKPEDNPFKTNMPFDTGFTVVGSSVANILDPDHKPTDYFVSGLYKRLINSKGQTLGHFLGETIPFLYDTEGNKTNYFLNGHICQKIMYFKRDSS